MASDINKFTQRIAQSFPKQQKFTFELEDLLKDTACHKQLRISQIDLIDILSSPTPEEGEIMKLISENNLKVKSDLPPVTAQHRRSLEEYLGPYGISYLQWDNFLGMGYDAFDLPRIPTRSISITFDQGKTGAWAPNGYGKTFAFEKVLALLDTTAAMNPIDAFEDFVRQCTAVSLPPLSNDQTPETLPLHQRSKRLIPFRKLCFSVQAFEGKIATNIFSVSIDMEYNASGHFKSFGISLHSPETRGYFAVDESVILPNWILENEIKEHTTYSELPRIKEKMNWQEIGLQTFLNLKISYIELPRVAFSDTAESIVQHNISIAINACIGSVLDNADKFDDIELDKSGLLAGLKDRKLVPSLQHLIADFFDDGEAGLGKKTLENLLSQLKDIEYQLNSLVGKSGESWRLECTLLTPLIGRNNSLDIVNVVHRTSPLKWNTLSFGQRNELLFKSTLVRWKYFRSAADNKQRVLVIDEPEAGRSEEWVSRLVSDMRQFEPTNTILILSHRGIVLESTNPDGKYKILHQPKRLEFDEEEEAEWKTHINSIGDSSVIENNLTRLKAFSPIGTIFSPQSSLGQTWAVKFPENITPEGEDWLNFVDNLWYLKPEEMSSLEYQEISRMIVKLSSAMSDNPTLNNFFHLPPQYILKIFWNGHQWVPDEAFERYEGLISQHLPPTPLEDSIIHDETVSSITVQSREPLSKIVTKDIWKIKGITVGGLALPKSPAKLLELLALYNKIVKEHSHELDFSQMLEVAKNAQITGISKNNINHLFKFLDRQKPNYSKAVQSPLALDEEPHFSTNIPIGMNRANQISSPSSNYMLERFVTYLLEDLKINMPDEPQSVSDEQVGAKAKIHFAQLNVLLLNPSSIDSREAKVKTSRLRREAALSQLKYSQVDTENRLFVQMLVSLLSAMSNPSDYLISKTLSIKPKSLVNERLGDYYEAIASVLQPSEYAIQSFAEKYQAYKNLITQGPATYISAVEKPHTPSFDPQISNAIRAFDISKLPHSAEFNFSNFAWPLNSLNDSRLTHNIHPYACELILEVAQRIHSRRKSIQPSYGAKEELLARATKEYPPNWFERRTLISHKSILAAAKTISDLDARIDYEKFDDPCGTTALIRVDIIKHEAKMRDRTAVDLTGSLGYRCMNCSKRYNADYEEIS